MEGATPILWSRVQACAVDRAAGAFFHAPGNRSVGRSSDHRRKGLRRAWTTVAKLGVTVTLIRRSRRARERGGVGDELPPHPQSPNTAAIASAMALG